MKTYENDKGVKFTSFATEMEPGLVEQTFEIAGRFSDAKVVLMPDAHVGTPAPIGLTIDFNSIKPTERFDIVELVGNDIGCGVTSFGLKFKRKLTTKEIESIYDFIEKNIPVFSHVDDYGKKDTYATLGSGNHFIELGEINDFGAYLLTVHSGSRARGAEVHKKYCKVSESPQKNVIKNEFIDILKRANLQSRIQELLDDADFESIGNAMDDSVWQDYIDEMRRAVSWAHNSRLDMLSVIAGYISDNILEFETFLEVNNTHNFFETQRYDIDGGVLRKGAIPQKDDGFLLTPLSMKEGIIVSLPMGGYENNYSAMHGAGRSLSRKLARQSISMDKFKDDMEGIVAHPREEILDEAPDAYKTKETILSDSSELCMPLFVAKPVMNFKGADRKYDKKK